MQTRNRLRDIARKPIFDPLVHREQSLAFYFSRHRETYVKHAETVRPYCDFVLNGVLSVETVAGQIYGAMLARQA